MTVDLANECRAALGNPNMAAFLRVIRAGESSQTDDAYRMLFGGDLAQGDLRDHPRKTITRGSLTSTAAGAYQFLARTWDECAAALALPDFAPDSQDLAAVFLVRRRGALADVLEGRIPDALAKCNHEWASLPGSPYGQPTRTMAQALDTFLRWGGALHGGASVAHATQVPPDPEKAPNAAIPGPAAPSDAPAYQTDAMGAPILATRPVDEYAAQGNNPMTPFIAAALPALVDAAPALIRVFGGGSVVTERNAKAAEVVAGIARQATLEPTVEGAVAAIQADPAKAAAYREAVHQSLGDLLSVLDSATQIDEKTRAAALDRNLQLAQATGGKWLYLLGGVAALVIVLSYAITSAVLFGRDFTSETKALLLGQVVIMGFAAVLQWLFGSNIANRIAQRDAKDAPP